MNILIFLYFNFLVSSLSWGTAFSPINGQSLQLFLEIHTFSCSQGSYSVRYCNNSSTLSNKIKEEGKNYSPPFPPSFCQSVAKIYLEHMLFLTTAVTFFDFFVVLLFFKDLFIDLGESGSESVHV